MKRNMTFLSAIFFSLFLQCTLLVAGPTADKAALAAPFPEISLVDLKVLVDKKGVFVIDANGDKSYQDSHIPGAIHLKQHELDLAKVLPADKSALIVAYCGGPMCTAWQEAATKAKSLGYTNIRHLRAGIKGWRDAKYVTESTPAPKVKG